MYVNNLYYPQKPKSKLEEYNEKLKERELYTNNILDRFIENGSGAPKHDQNGNLITKRRTLLNDNYEDFIIGQQISSPNNLNKTFSNKNNQNQNSNSNYKFYQSFSKNQSNNILDDNLNDNTNIINSISQNFNKNVNINGNINNILSNTLTQSQLRQELNQNNNNKNKRSTPYVKNSQQLNGQTPNNREQELNNNKKGKNKNEEDDNIFVEYTGLGILPWKSNNDDKMQKYLREEALKDEYKKEIERKRLLKEMEIQREKELDLREDLKVKKAIEEERRILKIQQRQKEEEEAKINEQNMINSQKQKRKRSLIDIDAYYGKNITFKKTNKPIEDNNDNNNNDEITENNNNINNMDNNNNNNNMNMNNGNNLDNDLYNNKLNNIYNRLNNLQNIRKIKQDTINNINNFDLNINKKNDEIDKEIKELRKDIRNQYIEMSDLFNQLKYNINVANQYKLGKERESKIIKDQLLKNRMAEVLTKNVLQRNYEDNMNMNYDELITNKNISIIDSNTNLQGTSNFIYINNDNNNTTDNLNLNSNENNNGLSSLAQAGKNVIELAGENELIPTNNNILRKEDNQFDINKLDFINEERKNEENNNKKSLELFMKEIERDKIYNYHLDEEFSMEGLYKDLDVIEKINQNFSPSNKLETLRNNFNVDYGDENNENKNKET